MLVFFHAKRYIPYKTSVALILIFTFLFNLAPLGLLKDRALAETVVKPVELVEKRSETSKIFDNGNGTYTLKVFSTPVHFLKDGVWEEIDSNIKPSGNGDFENANNRFKARFAGKGKAADLTSFEYHGLKATFSLQGVPNLGANYHTEANEAVPEVKDNSIRYTDIFPDVDLRQIVTGYGIKEDIILKKYNGKNSFVFALKVSGVDAVKENDGSIGFYKKGQANAEKVFSIPKPFMVDSNIDPALGEGVRSDNVTQDVIQHGANIFITITADDNWLKAPERKYPVYIDPTISGSSITYDSYVSNAYPNSNYYVDWNTLGYYQLKCGYYDSTTGTNYTFIKFNTSSLNYKQVLSATFRIYTAHSYYTYTPTPVWLDTVVNSYWESPSITWNNKPTSGSPLQTNTYKDQWAAFDVTSAVKTWASNPANNNGFKMHENDYGTGYWKKFRGSESAGNIPELVVTYSDDRTNPTANISSPVNNGFAKGTLTITGTAADDVALASYKVEYGAGSAPAAWTQINSSTTPVSNGTLASWNTGSLNGTYTLKLTATDKSGNTSVTTKSVNVDNNPPQTGIKDFYSLSTNKVGYGTSQTNIANGNLILDFQDLSIPGRGLDLSIKRTYNSLDEASGILGKGWRFNAEMFLLEKADGSLTFVDGDGCRKEFAKNGAVYLNEPGVFYDITKNTDNTFTLTNREGISYKFRIDGKPGRITDRNGNFLAVNYDASGRLFESPILLPESLLLNTRVTK